MGYKRSDLPASGGDFFRAKDLQGQKLRLTIKEVELHHFEANKDNEARDKLVVSFDETDKLLPLNSTNANILFDEVDEDTDNWIGALIVLYVGETKMGPGVKVKVPEVAQPPARSAKAAAPRKPAPPAEADEDDDEDYA